MTQQPLTELTERIARLEAQIADLQARMPAHSVKPTMIQELDDLDDQLAEARAGLARARAHLPSHKWRSP